MIGGLWFRGSWCGLGLLIGLVSDSDLRRLKGDGLLKGEGLHLMDGLHLREDGMGLGLRGDKKRVDLGCVLGLKGDELRVDLGGDLGLCGKVGSMLTWVVSWD